MANTYSQIYYHIVFSVKNRENKFQLKNLESIFNVIGVVIADEGVVPIIVGGYTDHIHALVVAKPKYILSNIIANIKSRSNKWLKEKRLVDDQFEWQVGYSVFSVSRMSLESVKKYIENQESHHQKIGFKEEYIDLLKEADIEFDEKYLFDL